MNDTPNRPLYGFERKEVAYRFGEMKKQGKLNDNMLAARVGALLDRDPEEAKKEFGAVTLQEAGFSNIPSMMENFRKGLNGRGFLGGITSKTSEVLSSLVDTVNITGQNVLARIDIEPVIYDWFLTEFPLLDMIEKEPANGLSHTWDQRKVLSLSN